MIGSQHRDRLGEAAAQLVQMVGSIGEEVGGPAVAAHDDAVLVVAEVARAEPARPLGLVDEPLRLEEGQHLGHLAALVQAALAEPDVEGRAEALHLGAQARHQRGEGMVRIGIATGRRRQRLPARHLLGGERRGHLAQVEPVVAVLGDGQRLAGQLPPAGAQALAERRHLRARVVDVELARDLVAGGREQARQRGAEGRGAGADDDGRSGRIGAHELQADALAPTGHALAEIRTRGEDLAHHALLGADRQAKVEKAGAGDRGREAGQTLLAPGGQGGRQLPRRQAAGLGGQHGHVRAEVPMRAFARRHEGDLRRRQAAAEEGPIQLAVPLAEVVGDGRAQALLHTPPPGRPGTSSATSSRGASPQKRSRP